tara:strand:- start:436 stop:930 length:495 start_codon:yes stop_codon:yes gene_type:complete
MTRYLYADNLYETVADVEKAVTSFKLRLDNNPTDWCGLRLVTESRILTVHSPSSATLEPDGSDTPAIVKSSSSEPMAVNAYNYGDLLTDEQINGLFGSNENFYNVFAVHDGDNHTYVSEPEALNLISQIRTSYARWKKADKYYDMQVDGGIEIDVSNEDMAQYV